MKKTALILIAIVIASISFAQTEVRVKNLNLTNGLAISGYDPVAYFTENKAVEGNKQWAYTYEGVTYYFANANNMQLFINKPASYEAQYGGWCAYSMGNLNVKEEIDPKTFKILNGKLYLFYHTLATNTLKKWNKDEERLKPLGDINWTAMFR